MPHGEVHRHFYESKVVKGLPGGRSEYFVYTPPGYDARAGLTVKASLLEGEFKKGEAVSEKKLSQLALQPHDVCPTWNYNVVPRMSGEAIGSRES